MLLGLGLRLLLIAAAGAAVAAVCIYVSGKITKAKLQKEMAAKNIASAFIEEINNCDNVVKLSDLDSECEIEIRGDGIDDQLEEGDVIYA